MKTSLFLCANVLAFLPFTAQSQCTDMTLTFTGTSICFGNELTLDAEGIGDIITWDGGVIDGVPFLPGDPGIYSYTAMSDNPLDCPLTVEIEVFSLPTVLAGSGDENYCEGESVVLSAGGDADDYNWEPLDLNPGVGTHTYTLTGSYDSGCTSTATVDITVHPLPTITATVDDPIICIGGALVFSASGATEYSWDFGIEPGEPYIPEMPGDWLFSVIGTDENGCVNTGTVAVEVLENIEITGTTTDEIIGEDGAIEISIAGGATPYTVDWDNDGTGDFDDPGNISGLTGGTYSVIIQGSEGCEGTASFTVNSQLSIEKTDNQVLEIYPNPTTNNLFINNPGKFNYQLIAINGDILETGSAIDQKQVDLSQLANGVYFIQVKNDSEVLTQKVIKK